jgi:gamma-glutamyl-gamma-aminobutyrate hydrolase PuuD
MKKTALTLCLIAAAFGGLMAGPVDQQKAQKLGAKFLSTTSLSQRNAGIQLQLVSTASNRNAVDYYVFNVANGEGFVIVAGDDRVKPILAYSTTGQYDPNNVAEGFQFTLDGFREEIQYVREHKIPFLGICYGMQLAVVEFARHVCGMKDAGTMETESPSHHVKDPVIAYLPGQDKIKEMGATMRLGGHDVLIRKDSLAEKVYGSTEIRERFRHRYEVNPAYVEKLEKGGIIFSGKAKNEDIMQIMELPDHPFFMACQFHPELKSSLLHPAPLFLGLLKAADERA